MTFTEKRRYKKLSKVYMTLAYVFAGLFMLSFVLLFMHIINRTEVRPFWALMVFMGPFISALVLAIISEYYAAKRKIYKVAIRIYREYKRFNKILEYLEDGKIELANILTNSFPANNYMRIFLKGHILAYKLKGDNAENKAYALQKMEELKEVFSPYNVKFE